MCTVQARTNAFADLEKRQAAALAAKQEAQRIREAALAVAELVDKYRDAAHVLHRQILDEKLTVDEARKTPAGLAALIIGMEITMGQCWREGTSSFSLFHSLKFLDATLSDYSTEAQRGRERKQMRGSQRTGERAQVQEREGVCARGES